MKELLKQKKMQYGIGGAIIILILIIIFVISQMDQVKVDFKLKENVIEYGSDPSKIEWEKLSETNGNKITVKEFDTKKVGQTDIVFTVCLDDTCKEFTEQVEIKDTKNPEIKFKKEKLEITAKRSVPGSTPSCTDWSGFMHECLSRRSATSWW